MVYGEEKLFCTGPTRAAKAEQKSLVPARQAQRSKQGRTPFICTLWVPIRLSFNSQPRATPLYSLSDANIANNVGNFSSRQIIKQSVCVSINYPHKTRLDHFCLLIPIFAEVCFNYCTVLYTPNFEYYEENSTEESKFHVFQFTRNDIIF